MYGNTHNPGGGLSALRTMGTGANVQGRERMARYTGPEARPANGVDGIRNAMRPIPQTPQRVAPPQQNRPPMPQQANQPQRPISGVEAIRQNFLARTQKYGR